MKNELTKEAAIKLIATSMKTELDSVHRAELSLASVLEKLHTRITDSGYSSVQFISFAAAAGETLGYSGKYIREVIRDTMGLRTRAERSDAGSKKKAKTGKYSVDAINAAAAKAGLTKAQIVALLAAL